MEDYKNKYEDLLDVIKDLYPNMTEYQQEKFQGVCPELKESEDERIRKAIKEAIEHYWSDDTQAMNDTLAWLEKQEEHANFRNKIQIGDKVTRNEDGVLVNLSQLNRVAKKNEKQGEQKPDKVEPKFKVGDWVIDKQGIVHQIANVIENVTYHTYGYDIVGGGYFNDNAEGVRLWTIQDAKDGDILYMDNGLSTCTFIYECINNNIIQKYASYDKFGFEGRHYLVLNDGYVCPVTKEQRDRLFQEMKEAGYEWDAEEKGLKKIEQKPTNNVIEEEKPLLEKFKQAVYDCAWGKVTCKKEGETKEEYAERWAEQFLLIVRDWADDYIDFTIQQKLRNSYEKGKTDVIEKLHGQQPAWSEEDASLCVRIQGILSVCKSHSLLSPDLHKEMCDWLKALKDRVQPQSKQEWSEEDEEMFNSLKTLLNDASCYSCTEGVDKILSWLKSPKPHWKPSAEQLKALKSASDKDWDIDGNSPLYTLYKDLEKL